MNRREFIQKAGLLGGYAAFAPYLSGPLPIWAKLAKASPLDPEKIGVLQGPTGETSTLISLVAHKKHNLRFYFNDSALTFRATAINLVYGDFIVHNLRIDGLAPDRPYELRVESDLGLSERRFFRALDWKKRDGRLAVLSCTNHKKADPQARMCAQLSAARPDAILFLGDLVYANRGIDTIRGDAVKPDIAYDNYVRTLQNIDLYRQENLIPIFYIWDDHDIGKNNADASHPYMGQMMQIFRAFFPMEAVSPAMTLGPGFSFALEIFGTQIIVFDERTFTTEHGGLLGAPQMAWVAGQMARAQGPLLLAGSQLFWKYHWWGESFQKKAAPELGRLLEMIRAQKRPALFVSGDVHYSQIQEIPRDRVGYTTYEITSSALFSRSADKLGRRKPAEGQLAYYGQPNFIMLDRMSGNESTFDARVTCISEDATVFSRDLHITL